VNANDIERQKYLRLFTQVEALEERIALLEQDGKRVDELRLLLEQLATARTELTRVSNGCGQPRTKA
jgi:hypothetical protein